MIALERSDVGCQSEVTEKRDAAVQVDLPTHTGVCTCVCGRALQNVPAADALHSPRPTIPLFDPLSPIDTKGLQTDSEGLQNPEAIELQTESIEVQTSEEFFQDPDGPLKESLELQTSESKELQHGVSLPTMPGLFQEEPLKESLELQTSESIELQTSESIELQTSESIELQTSESIGLQHGLRLPIMPLCGLSPPPKGLMAPLSPHHAEEDEDRQMTEEERWVEPRPRRKAVGPPIRYLLESEERTNQSRARSLEWEGLNVHSVNMTEHGPVVVINDEQANDASSPPSGITTAVIPPKKKRGRPRKRFHHDIAVAIETTQADSQSEESVQKISACREETNRPRRKRVGPPIRYLLESEERTNHSRDRKLIEEERTNPSRDRKLLEEERTNHSRDRRKGAGLEHPAVGGGASQLSKFYRSKLWLGRKRKRFPYYRGNTGRFSKPRPPVKTEAPDWTRQRNVVRSRKDKIRKFKQEEEERQMAEVERQCQRPRRKAVGPPIRYLLESEVMSHGRVAANHERDKQKAFLSANEQRDKAFLSANEEMDEQKFFLPPLEAEKKSECPYKLSYLLHRDSHNSLVTIIPPCCVKLQRLL